MRTLLLVATACAALTAIPAAGLAQTTGDTGATTPPAAQPPVQGAPGILVTPPIRRQVTPPAGEAGAKGEESSNTPQEGGGCRYVPGKLDLIV